MAHNEEHNLPRALSSLPARTRILVVDHGSADGTVALAKGFGAEVIERPFQGFVEARSFAREQVRTPWTLMIDADEALDDALSAAILAADGSAMGYRVRRTTYYRGRALRMWKNERLLRLFRTQNARLQSAPAAGGAAQLHEFWSADPPVETLAGTLLHYSYPTHAEYARKFDRYTSIEAGGMQTTRWRAGVQIALVPVRFFWYAVGRAALLDGSRGLRIAWASAAYPAVVQRKALRRR